MSATCLSLLPNHHPILSGDSMRSTAGYAAEENRSDEMLKAARADAKIKDEIMTEAAEYADKAAAALEAAKRAASEGGVNAKRQIPMLTEVHQEAVKDIQNAMSEVMASQEAVSACSKSNANNGRITGMNIYKAFDGRGLAKYFPDMCVPKQLTALARAGMAACFNFPSDTVVIFRVLLMISYLTHGK